MRFFVLALVAVGLAGCSLNTNYFSDYTGANLLSSYEFNASGWATETYGTDGASATDPYMNWSDASTTGPGGGEAYKLEILNLIPDGNFFTSYTNTTINSSYWSSSAATVTIYNGSTTFAASSSSSTTTYASFIGSSTSGYLKLDLAASIEAITGLSAPASHQYQLQANFIDPNGSPFYVYNNNTLDSTSATATLATLTSSTVASGTLYEFASTSLGTTSVLNLTYSSSFGASNLVFGYSDSYHNPNATEQFYLSNVRLVPDTDTLYTKLSLPSLYSTSRQLIPGTYQFSLYVKDDPNAGTSSNHFYAKGLTVRFTIGAKSSLTKQVVVTATRTSSWSSWTKLTFSLGTLDFVDSNSALTSGSTTYPALVIEISPTIMNSGTKDSGAVYISDPTLTFISS